MKKIAVIIDDFFEESEYFQPVGVLSTAGYEIINIGLRKGKIVKDKNKQREVDIDESINESSIDDFDALLIPGGYSPDKLRSHDEAVAFVRDFVKSGKPVFSICHGPQLLISADVLKNRRITGWKSIIQDIKNAGADFIDQEVVIDDNIISSRSPADLKPFIKATLNKLE